MVLLKPPNLFCLLSKLAKYYSFDTTGDYNFGPLCFIAPVSGPS
jgi:hypothetical protein